jgi:hypothetical protein
MSTLSQSRAYGSDLKQQAWPHFLVIAGSALVLLGYLIMMIGQSSDPTYPSGYWKTMLLMTVVPIVVIVLLTTSLRRGKFALLTQSAAIVIVLYGAGPSLLQFLFLLRADLGQAGWGIASGIFFVLAAVLGLAGVAWMVARMRKHLLAPANRSSFQVDTTTLLALFAVTGLLVMGFSDSTTVQSVVGFDRLAYIDGDYVSFVQAYSFHVSSFYLALAWVLPVTMWLAFALRRGGAVALGGAAGAAAALLGLPLFLGLLQSLFTRESDNIMWWWSPAGGNPISAAIALALLIVVVIWVVSAPGEPPLPGPRPPAGSPVNTLSVVAFALAWFPLTWIVGLVLGHMSYDQVLANPGQRGISLSRWAIAVSYVLCVGSVVYLVN